MVTRQPLLFADDAGVSGVLTDAEIRDAVDRGWLITNGTFSESSLEPSSYDVRVGAKGVMGGDGTEVDLNSHAMELGPGAYAGVISHERFALAEKICARIGSKRALAYDGIILLTGSTIDPGYEGHLLFCLYNASQRKVLIRHGKKLCNVVFERLSKPPDNLVPVGDLNLRTGNFPDAFLDRMANMEVLPWVQINERVKQIETITKDIIDLKARYEDVLQPIRDLTNNVKSLSEDVESVNQLVGENSRQINQLTTHLSGITVGLQDVKDRAKTMEDTDRTRYEAFSTLRTDFGKFKIIGYIFWAIVLLIAGALLQKALSPVSPAPSLQVQPVQTLPPPVAAPPTPNPVSPRPVH